MSTRKRTILLVPVGALALLMALSSAAFACTLFRGTFTLQGNASSAKVKSTGTGTGMNQTISSGVAKASASGGTVKVWAGADANGVVLPPSSTLGPYQVRYYNGTAYASHQSNWLVDCMAGSSGVTLGSVTVTSRGKIQGQPVNLALPSSTPNTSPEESAVCISDASASYGNQVPLTIV